MADSKDQNSTTRVRALHQLREGFAPSRDLWPDIEKRITRGRARPDPTALVGAKRRRWPLAWLSVAAAALVLVTVGVWIGRSERMLSIARPGSTETASAVFTGNCISEAQYLRERSALLNTPAGTLAGLSVEGRQKVLASLATVHDAVHDIETALARDSPNPLLRELLVTTCEDETRVLSEIQVAGSAARTGRGI